MRDYVIMSVTMISHWYAFFVRRIPSTTFHDFNPILEYSLRERMMRHLFA